MRSNSYGYGFSVYYGSSQESDPSSRSSAGDPYAIYEPIYGRVGGINYFAPSRTYSTVPWIYPREDLYLHEWDE